jgi:FKBP-type peptidyl-prolyl cis-trans isomerase FkpA
MKKVAFLAVVLLGSLTSCKKTEELDYNQQLTKDDGLIDAYLKQNNIAAITDPSGLRYVVDTVGTGLKPTLDGNVSVKYSSVILGQTIPYDQSNGIILPLNQLIQGWQIALPLMTKGSYFRLYVPSGLAYGEAGSPGLIPANANLIYYIKLFDDDAQLKADIATIEAYLDTIPAGETAFKLPSGVFVNYSSKGTGPVPISTSNVTITFVTKLLSNQKVIFTQSTAETESISSLILGVQDALLAIPAGSQITIYIPSGLAYGPGGSSDGVIPANANLIFDLDLISSQ